MPSKPSSLVILGAGPTGLAAAYAARQTGFQVTVVDRATEPGGMARSFDFQGFTVDLGSHFLSTAPARVRELVGYALEGDTVPLRIQRRVLWQGAYYSYPPRVSEIAHGVGGLRAAGYLASMLAQSASGRTLPTNYAQQLQRQFGNRFFREFFEPYMTKMWGIPCDQISPEWLDGRYEGIGRRLAKALVQDLRSRCKRGPSSLADSPDGDYCHPRQGMGQLYQRLSQRLRAEGQTMRFETEATAIHIEAGRVQAVTLRDVGSGTEETLPCESLITTLPLPRMVQSIRPSAPKDVLAVGQQLGFRSILLVYLLVDSAPLFGDQCIYVADGDIDLVRVTNFANWSPSMKANESQTPLCCEYWLPAEDPRLSMAESQAVEMCERDLRQAGILKSEGIVAGRTIVLANAAPIYRAGHESALAVVHRYLGYVDNLALAGRAGSFRYADQDASLLMGMEAVAALQRRSAP